MFNTNIANANGFTLKMDVKSDELSTFNDAGIMFAVTLLIKVNIPMKIVFAWLKVIQIY